MSKIILQIYWNYMGILNLPDSRHPVKGIHFLSVEEVKAKTAQLLNSLGVDEL